MQERAPVLEPAIARRSHELIRSVYRRLIGQGERSSIYGALLLNRSCPEVKRIEFSDEPVLVVAPHMDDEVAGCGGTVALHRDAGAEIRIVFTTDGSRGRVVARDHQLTPLERQRQIAELVKTRKEESRNACALLGVRDLAFLDGPDGELRPTPRLVRELGKMIEALKPRIIYHPWLLDAHDDHWQTNRLLCQSLLSIGAATRMTGDLKMRGYEVWTPAYVNTVADISRVSELKQSAFAAFVSQNAQIDYPRTIMALNAYRAATTGSGQFAEAFHELSGSGFVDAVRRIEGHSTPVPVRESAA